MAGFGPEPDVAYPCCGMYCILFFLFVKSFIASNHFDVKTKKSCVCDWAANQIPPHKLTLGCGAVGGSVYSLNC